jgi:RNA polymerase sigma-70 factor (ECF subfamily)
MLVVLAMGELRPQPLRSTPADADRFVGASYDAHHGEVYAFLARATRDATVAEELLQETFLRLTEEVRTRRVPEQVRPWLYRVASNLVVSRARRRSTARQWLEGQRRSDHLRVVESPEAQMLRRERAGRLEQALGRLPADARVALLLSSDGFSGEEIASVIGRSHNATRSLLTRARIALRNELAGEDGA